MFQKIVNSRIHISLGILYLTPILLLIWYIAEFRVNVPSWDEWPVSMIFEKVATGELSFQDLVEPYNQHRYLFLRLIIIPLAFLTNWNKDYELACSVILAILTWMVILQISRRKITLSQGIIPFHLANSLTCFLILSLVQYQNWLWGLQIGVFLVNLCLAIAIFILDSHYSSHPRKSLFFAAIFCIIASATMAQGLASWLAIIPMILFLSNGRKRRIYSLLYWLGLFLLTSFLYFLGVTSSDPEPSKLAAFLEHPLYFLKFFFVVVGAPLAHYSSAIALWIGILTIILFLGLIIRGTILYKFKFIQQIAPWLSFAIFAILFCGLVTWGRAIIDLENSDGFNFALGSRYTTNTLFFIIAILQIYYSLISQTRHQISRLSPQIIGVPLVLIILVGINSINSIQNGKIYHHRLESEKICLSLLQVIDEKHYCLDWWEIMIFPEKMRNHAQLLNSLDFINSPNIEFIDDNRDIEGRITKPNLDQQMLVRNPDDVVSISGTVNLSQDFLSNNDFYFIGLSYGDRKTIIATNPPNYLNKKQDYNQKLSWKISLYARSLPLGEMRLKAWLYNPQKQQFIPLDGELSVKNIPQDIAQNVTFNTEPTETYGFLNSLPIPLVATSNQRVMVLGWARLPDQIKQPSHVFLSYGNDKFFAASTEVNLESLDVAKALGSNKYRRSRWLTTIPTWTLSPGETTIKAWVYDPQRKQFIKLNNETPVKVFPKDTPFVTQSQEIYGYIDSSKISDSSLTLSRHQVLPLEGWARLPNSVEQPKTVMFSYGNEQSFFGTADVNLGSSDIAEAFNSEKYNQARWKAILPMMSLPLGETAIKAWIYHPEKKQFMQLENQVSVTIVQ